MKNKYITLKWLAIILLVSGLAACDYYLPAPGGSSSYPTHQGSTSHYQSQDDYTAEQYLQMAQDAASPEKQRYQLSAADKFLQENNTSEASRVLDSVDQAALNSELRSYQQILRGKLALLQNNPGQTISLLNAEQSSISQQPYHVKVDYYQTLAQAYDVTNDPNASVQQRIALGALLSDPNVRKQNDLAIWQTLQALPTPTLNASALSASDQQLKGWYQLAYVARAYNNNPQALLDNVQVWQHEYGNHPANQLLSNDLNDDNLLTAPKNIVLLLPLKGNLGKSADAIRNGFLAAYYDDKRNNGNVPTVSVEDISGQSVVSAYNNAVNNGADFIVGPLTKNNVRALLESSDLRTPVLALNNVTGLDSPANTFQFGLSPQDGARQAASRAWLHGLNKALVITPQGSWGESIAEAFNTQWQQLGGEVIDSMSYASRENMGPPLEALLQVQKSGTDGVPQRRQDVNMIFLAADARAARQIKPLLKFYYAGNLPVYATSMVYNGVPNPASDKDMDGIIFSDAPWVLDDSGSAREARAAAAKVWPGAVGRYAKLYAMGLDAYRLSTQLNRLILLPEFGVSGETGLLTLDNQNHIHRQLMWAQFQQGLPQLLSPEPR